MNNIPVNVDVARIEEAIEMLSTNVKAEGIDSFISILQEIKLAPDNKLLLRQLYDAFQNLGITQGAVLTFAPSIYDLIVVDPFNEITPDSDYR